MGANPAGVVVRALQKRREGPLELGIQVQGSNNLKLLCSKGMVVSVRIMELDKSKGLKKYRTGNNAIKTRDFLSNWDKFGTNLITVRMVVGIEVTGT